MRSILFNAILLLTAQAGFAQSRVSTDSASVVYDTVYVMDSSASRSEEPRVNEESLGHCVMLPSDLDRCHQHRSCCDPCYRKD